ncbi:MAG: ATP-dependent endonuclease [Candidatus Thorarchaeota archaeon]
MKRGDAFELGSQGDGLKRILMLFVYLANYGGAILVLDEPERHLHPGIEERLLDYFLKYGQGQLMIGTHLEAIVNSISGESLEGGDVVVYSLALDDANRTVAHRVNESNMVKAIEKLGVPVTRYVRLMAALSKTLVFVEGPTDRRAIEAILEKHGRLKEFRKYRPFVIPVGGIHSIRKISPELIDNVAKGDDSIKSGPVPHLTISDRDETKRKEKENEVILTVREIENTVVSESAVRTVAKNYLTELGFTPSEEYQCIFDDCLKGEVEQYLPRFTLLNLWSQIARDVGPLTWSESVGYPSKEEARSILLNRIESVEAVLEDLVGRHNEDHFNREYDRFRTKCFRKGGGLEYDYVLVNISGKDFIKRILRRALIRTASSVGQEMTQTEFDTDEAANMAGQMVTFRSLVEISEQLHPDLQRILKKLEDIHNSDRKF